MRKSQTFFKWITFMVILCGYYGFAFGQTQITDVAGLKAIKGDGETADKSYILMNDIDLTDVVWTLNDLPQEFQGSFDGNGKTIKNFTLEGNSENIGFFRKLSGTVRNLGFENATVSATAQNVGVLVGQMNGGLVENCYVNNSTVSGTGNRVAGLVGNTENGAIIRNSYLINSSVTGVAEREAIGGVAGRVAGESTVEKCYTEFSTIYGANDVGAIVGRLFNKSVLKLSYSTNSVVNGNNNVAGVLGRLFGPDCLIENCYSSARVHSRSFQAGGVVGQATDGEATINNCYFSGVLTRYGTNRAGGIMALDGINGDTEFLTIANSANLAALMVSDELYRIVSLNGKIANLTNNYALENIQATHGNSEENGQDVSAASARTQSFYEETLKWDFNDTWKMTNGYPVLKWQTEVHASVLQEALENKLELLEGAGETIDLSGFLSGNGLELTFFTNNPKINVSNGKVQLNPDAEIDDIEIAEVIVSVNDPAIADGKILVTLIPTGEVKISSAADFISKISIASAGNFKLTADLDFTGMDFYGIETFSGSLDGNGHIIKGINYSNDGMNDMGLFRTITNATIKNLGLEEVNLRGNENIGGLVGKAEGGRIEGCYVTNSSLNANDRAAGIAAYASGGLVIENCYVIANIIGRSQQKGGIIASSGGEVTINNCYFAGNISGGRFSGSMMGLLDTNATVKIQNCLNLATSITNNTSHTDDTRPFRIAAWGGREAYAQFTNNYSISTTTGGEWDENNAQDGKNLPEDEAAKSIDFYIETLGWNTDVWKIINGYPVFTWQQIPVTTQLLDATYSYLLVPGETLNLNDEFKAANGAEIAFVSNSEFITIDANNIATVSENIDGSLSATITVSAENTVILENVIYIKVVGTTGVIKIATPYDLMLVTSHPARDFELENDIDMTGVEFTGLCSENDPFTGTFDGKGFVIKGLQYSDESVNNIGLFRKTKEALIRNLGLTDVNFTGNENIAGIAGSAEGGRFEQCYVVNSVINGRDRASGIAAWVMNEDTEIINCFVSAEIIAREHQLGGIVAANYRSDNREDVKRLTIRNCYFVGTLEGKYGHAGAILGLMDRDMDVEIENCINLATSINSENAYRISNWGSREHYAIFNDNYSLSTTTTNRVGGWVMEDARDGITLSDDAEAMSLEFYENTLGWDFESVWTINEGEGYPTLKIFVKEEGIVIEGNVMKVLSHFDVANLADLFIPDYITAVDMTEVTLVAGTVLPTPSNPNCLIYVNNEADNAIVNTTNVVVVGDNATAVKIELTDDNAFANIVNFTTSDITFTRTDLTENNFSTIYLPFSVAVPQGMKAYAFDKIENGSAVFEEVTDVLTANTPYLFKHSAGELTLSVQTEVTIAITEEDDTATPDSFIGTFRSITPTGNYYGYSEGNFVKGSGSEVPAFRGYIQGQSGADAPASFAVKLVDTTGIEDITNAEMVILSAQGAIEIIAVQSQSVNVYSVEGRLVRSVVLSEGYNKIDGLASGLYLINNTKVIVK